MESTIRDLSTRRAQLIWRKSSWSGPNCDNCVEVAQLTAAVAVRDSLLPAGPVLAVPADAWREFLADLR